MTSVPPTTRPFTLAAKPRELTPLDPATVRLSVLIPVYNERNTIETILDRVHATPIRKEIICVDDCSTDGTRERLVELHAAGYIDQLILQQENGGKGKAIRTALAASTGDIVIVQDADLEYDPQDWPVLLEPIVDGKADACFGSRFLGGPHRVLYYWHSVGNTLLTLFSNMLTNLNLTDMETCYKAVRGDLARSLHAHVGPVRVRARDHGAAREARRAHLRGADLVRGAHLRRRQEDQLEGRRRRVLAHPEVQSAGMTDQTRRWLLPASVALLALAALHHEHRTRLHVRRSRT